MQRDLESARGIVVRQRVVNGPDRFVFAGERGSENRNNADGVLIQRADDLLRRDRVPTGGHWKVPRLDIPVLAKLLPHDLDVRAEDEVRLLCVRRANTTTRAPAPFHRETGQHHRLTRSDRGRPDRIAGRMEQVADHVHAAPFQLGGLRVLVLIDHVLVEGLGHESIGLRLHPCGDERRKIEPTAPVEQQLVVDQPIRGVSIETFGGQGILGQRNHTRPAAVGNAKVRRWILRSVGHVCLS